MAGEAQVGVEAVVMGLQSFMGDMGKMKNSIADVVPSSSLLLDAFGALGNMAQDLGKWIGDVLAYTIGGLLKDAIEGVLQMMGELIQKTIEAGSQFQTLTLRLNGINMDALTKSGMDYVEASEKAVEMTKEQLDWLQKLAMTTPYDNTDISNIYTLARSYGFADDAARQLTKSTTDFASGMGLSGEVLERIIINMGQMVQRGKITGTELKDLARGAFLPLGDIMDRISSKMGITTAALTKKISTPGGGVPVQPFIDAFNEMVAQEPRFRGAAERMAQTAKAAADNFMDLFSSIGGLQIVKPILDTVGGYIAGFMNAFSNSDGALNGVMSLQDRLVAAAGDIGAALNGIVQFILSTFLPSADDMASGFVGAVEQISIRRARFAR